MYIGRYKATCIRYFLINGDWLNHIIEYLFLFFFVLFASLLLIFCDFSSSRYLIFVSDLLDLFVFD